MTALLSRLRHLLGRARFEADLREEMETHRALRQDALEREGLSPEAARGASRRALGNIGLAIEDSRDIWTLRAMDAVRQDVRAASRTLRKSPAFAAVAIGTLALGIGANTALFSIFSSLLLRPLPVREPDGLVLLARGSWTYPIWQELQRLDGDVVDGAAAWADERFDLSQAGETAFVDGAFVSGRYFEVLGVRPARGRLLMPADDVEYAPHGAVAVISTQLWTDRFGGADDVLGRQITIERVPFTIVGVMPPEFFGVEVGRRADVMVPFGAEPLLRRVDTVLHERSTWWLEVLMRLKPGQSVEQATAALRAVQPHLRTATMPDWPEEMRRHYLGDPFTLVPASTGRSTLRSSFRTPLAAMVVGVGLVLLVACANIASLLLARALSRQRELSVRLALGASRWRVARLLLTESFLVAVAGAVAGLWFARWCSGVLVAQLTTWQDAVFLDLALDWRVLVFTAALTCAATIIAGVAPVLGVRDIAPVTSIKDGGRGIAGDARFAIRGSLVVAQIAVSLLLVIGAGLFLRTFASLGRVPLGFEPGSRLVAEINMQRSAVPAPERLALVQRLLDVARAAPGVTSAAIAAKTPGTSAGTNNWVGDSAAPPSDRQLMTWIHFTTPGWFQTMGMERLAGRDFDTSDRAGAAHVAIVNETFAARFLPPGSPIGRTVRLGHPGGGPAYQVIGVVRDAIYRSPREGRVPIVHLPLAQQEQVPSTVSLTVTTGVGRASMQEALTAAITRTDPAVAVTFRTFDRLLDATVAPERLAALMSTFFGGLALLLAAIGVYGIVAHGVRARQTEIGVRVALGASPSRIVRLVLQGVSVLLVVGIALGVAAAFWAAPLVDALLFGHQARDAVTFAGAAATLAVVGVIAAWVPARRAAHFEPARILREG